MFNKLLTFLFLFVFISSIRGNSGYEKYKILSMNNQPSVVDFNQFAGFITVDYKNGRSLFFYFVEAEADPASKPVFLWINNAGPGCSSYGSIFEKGPFRPTSEVANMLYLDAPAGFGFSYSNNTADYSLVLNEDFAARDNLVFLHHWFNEFSQYKSNDLYIGGEKNAARSAAKLAELIVKNNESFNLQGVAAFKTLAGIMSGISEAGLLDQNSWVWSLYDNSTILTEMEATEEPNVRIAEAGLSDQNSGVWSLGDKSTILTEMETAEFASLHSILQHTSVRLVAFNCTLFR